MFVLAATAAFATAGGPDHFLVRNVSKGSVLNIRAAPDREAEILGTIPHDGDGIRNLGCEGLMDFADWQTASEAEREAAADRVWCRIEYGGITGWSAGRFLGEGSAP